MGEKDQENPLSWDSIEPAPYKKPGNLVNYDFALSQSSKRLKDNPYTQLLEQQARRIEAQQDNYVYTLNYDDYLTERELSKKISEKFSVLKDYKSDMTFEWIQEPGVPNDEVVKEKKKQADRNPSKGFLYFRGCEYFGRFEYQS